MHRRIIAASLAASMLAFVGAATGAHSGNGAPSGPHYDLNIIGVPHDKSANMNQGGGNVIFVDLGTKNGAPVNPRRM